MEEEQVCYTRHWQGPYMDSRLWLHRRVPLSSHKPPAALDDPDRIDLTFDSYVHLSYYDEVYQCRPHSSSPPHRDPHPYPAKPSVLASPPPARPSWVLIKEVVLTKDNDSLDDDYAICLKALVDRYQEDGVASTQPTMSTLWAIPYSHFFHQHCIF
jgi:hypothetical protein